MAQSNNNLILLGVIGLGAFFLMSRPGMANGLAPRPQQQQGINPVQWLSAIAAGLAGRFGSSGSTSGIPIAPNYGAGDFSSGMANPYDPVSPTRENFYMNSLANRYSSGAPNYGAGSFSGGTAQSNIWNSYAGGGNDGVALNPANGDPWGWAQYMG